MKEIIDITKQIQQRRNNPVLILDLKYVQKQDLVHLHKLLQGRTFETLDVILQTDGGDMDTLFAFAKLLRTTAKEELNIIIPPYSKMGGTLICLAADEILMTELSEVSPLDTQLREYKNSNTVHYVSALDGFKALEHVQAYSIETMDVVRELIEERSGLNETEAIMLATDFAGSTSQSLYADLNPAKIGEYGRALEIGEHYGKIILTRYMGWDEESAELTLNKLVYQYPSSNFSIDCEELQHIDLPAELVDGTVADLLFELREVLLRSRKTTIELMDTITAENQQENANGVQQHEHEHQQVGEMAIPQN